MNQLCRRLSCALITFATATAHSQDNLGAAFKEGVVTGNLRAYYNTRNYSWREDEAGFALGGGLRAETAAIGDAFWVKLGSGFYVAHDLGINSDDPQKVNARLGDELEVLGEAYLKLGLGETTATFGRQLINTPFANPGDAFMVPMTFHGYSFENKSFSSASLYAMYLTEFKNRPSDEFLATSAWTAARYGVDDSSAEGTFVLGGKSSLSSLALEAWYYEFVDFFNMVYLQGDYVLTLRDSIKPFVGAQYATQRDSGDNLLGEVSSSLYGIRAGSSWGNWVLSLAYNLVPDKADAFNNGAVLAPFNFSTSAIFTNSMLESLENLDSGNASKITIDYTFNNQLVGRLSWATLDFDTIANRTETHLDVTYKFSGNLQGFSIRNRLTLVDSDLETVEQVNNRVQLQFLF